MQQRAPEVYVLASSNYKQQKQKAMATLLSKVVTKTDVESYLSITTSCSLEHQQLPFEEGHTVNMYVHDDGGREWIFPCCIRRDETSGRHFLCVSWGEFAGEKGVRVGDQVIIHEQIIKHQVIATAATSLMKIEVHRKIRLMGVDIWANVQ